MEPTRTDFALVVFDHTEGAERAYADAPKRDRDIDWAQDVAFVEHHSHDRLVIRGPFAGHYVDADDALEAEGGRLVRHRLEPETALALEDAVATSPAAAGR